MPLPTDLVASFLKAATVSPSGHHAGGSAEAATELLRTHPELADVDIYTAAVAGNTDGVRRFLAEDPTRATAKGGPYEWDALTYLCFSRLLPRETDLPSNFDQAATLLLDAGADANTGWFENAHRPNPEFESVLYGAAGIAHNATLTRLLLSRGANPNDGETVYHSPETFETGNRAMEAVVETGNVEPGNLAMMLARKHDFHDYDGVKWLLEHGADPNHLKTLRVRTPLAHGVQRDNDAAIVELALTHRGDPTIAGSEGSAASIAARRGRGDLLAMFERYGFAVRFEGVDELLAACARDDPAAIQRIGSQRPTLVAELVAQGGDRLAEFAGTGNAAGVARLLDLGVPVSATYRGDGYFGIASGATALHVAAWRAQPAVVRLLIACGASVNVRDSKGNTALMLAVRACVDSWWRERRTPDSVRLLLDADASVEGVSYPSGYDEVDALLASRLSSA